MCSSICAPQAVCSLALRVVQSKRLLQLLGDMREWGFVPQRDEYDQCLQVLAHVRRDKPRQAASR